MESRRSEDGSDGFRVGMWVSLGAAVGATIGLVLEVLLGDGTVSYVIGGGIGGALVLRYLDRRGQ